MKPTPRSLTPLILVAALILLGSAPANASSIRFDGGGSVLEGDTGAQYVTFRAYAAGPLDVPIPFDFYTTDITATGGVVVETRPVRDPRQGTAWWRVDMT